MTLDKMFPPRTAININRALAPWVRNPGVGSGVRCYFCQSDEVYHIGGIRDFWLCFKCSARLKVTENKK
jgi:hypothetical protein